MTKHILVVDDDDSLRRVMEYTLLEAGYVVSTARDGDQALIFVRKNKPCLIVTDLKMKRVGGLELLKEVRRNFPDILTIIVTAFGSIESAVDAMRLGAHDYLVKPFSRDALRLVVQRALAYHDIQCENLRLRQEIKQDHSPDVIASSLVMQKTLKMLDRAAGSDFSVLLYGESGTGKELLASRLHKLSLRSEKPFIALNCAAIPDGLIESELFGHQKGSFTGATTDRKGKFEQASGGTLFLDEIGELPLEQQPKLLRALQLGEIEPVGGSTRSVDVRVVAATNMDLERAIKEGRFREDLYYRLAVIPLQVPSLRERSEDIPLLAQHFLQRIDPDRQFKISPQVITELQRYSWPGNVRELENLMMRLSVLTTEDTIMLSDLPANISRQSFSPQGIFALPARGLSLEALEKTAVLQALERSEGNRAQAARLLQIPRHVLVYRLEKYNLKEK